jgi:4-hydroxybenzoate polyprenyltransferase
MSFADALRLGRISNLPTVWTNAVAGVALCGMPETVSPQVVLLLALIILGASLAYVGGMFLNDAFDAEIDAAQRPERPIPSGRVSRRDVYRIGFGILAASIVLFGAAGLVGGTGLWPAGAALALAAAIVVYDSWHKNNPISPLLMGLCRVLVYVVAGLCVTTSLPVALWIGAGMLLSHLIGLTYIAKQETLGRIANLWPLFFLASPIVAGYVLIFFSPGAQTFLLALIGADLIALLFLLRRKPDDIPRAVITLIAAISLLDAMLIAGTGHPQLATAAAGAFILTLAMQIFVRGT